MADSIETALYIVATPIGNLSDITFRAVNILKSVDVIAAEDTRNTSVLLEKYNISTRLISYHKFSETSRLELFLNYLKEGKSIALVSDAGTPLICDPGEILVKEVKKEGFKVIPIGGISAITTLLSASPKGSEDFKFIGFIQRSEKQIKETILQNKYENLIFYESPNRLIETLETIQTANPDAIITIGRELTKKFEEIITDSVENIISYYKNNVLKGEIAILLHKSLIKDEINLDDKIRKLKALKFKDKEISLILSELYNTNKNSVYKKCLELN